MTFEHFRARAETIFDEIPPDFKAGVDGLEVVRKTSFHPHLPDVYTLGECLSEFYPSEFGGAGEVRSRVVLYYGSFLALSRTRDDWDWEEELWETITHEVRHHLESLASDDALEEVDYAEDQNFARREGEPFDPFFYQSGTPRGAGTFEVDGDLFVEHPIDRRTLDPGVALSIPFGEATLAVRPPSELGDVHFLRVPEPPGEVAGELYVVLIPRRGAGEWLWGLLGRPRLDIRESDAEVEGG